VVFGVIKEGMNLATGTTMSQSSLYLTEYYLVAVFSLLAWIQQARMQAATFYPLFRTLYLFAMPENGSHLHVLASKVVLDVVAHGVRMKMMVMIIDDGGSCISLWS
jgi:hypothetical protein